MAYQHKNRVPLRSFVWVAYARIVNAGPASLTSASSTRSHPLPVPCVAPYIDPGAVPTALIPTAAAAAFDHMPFSSRAPSTGPVVRGRNLSWIEERLHLRYVRATSEMSLAICVTAAMSGSSALHSCRSH